MLPRIKSEENTFGKPVLADLRFTYTLFVTSLSTYLYTTKLEGGGLR